METQDYCNSCSFNIQVEKIVGKLRTNPVPILLQDPFTQSVSASGDQAPTTAFLQCPCQEHPVTNHPTNS